MISNEKLLEMRKKYEFDKVQEALESNVREEAARKAYNFKSNDLAIIKRIVGNTQTAKFNKSLTKNHQWEGKYGRTYNCFCDGYVVFGDSNTDFGIEAAEPHEKYDMSRLVGNTWSEICEEKVIEFDRADVAAFKKLNPSKKNVRPYIANIDEKRKAGFNPSYIWDAMNFTQSDKAYYVGDVVDYLKYPVIFTNDDETRFALVLPIKVNASNN